MRISVIKPFTFNAQGTLTRFEIGSHIVSDEVGTHPFTQAHCGELQTSGGEDSAEMMAQLQEAGRVLIDMRNQLDAARDERNSAMDDAAGLQARLDTANEQLADLQAKLEAATAEAAQAAEAMTALATANADLQGKLEAATSKKK